MDFGLVDILTLLGSLALFLYGMKLMSDSLMEVAGDRMRNILASMTSNRVFAVLTGFVITSVIQSSSATTLMAVSFVNASLLTLTESVGVIMGSNIGTTITAWLITILGFKVSMSAIALPIVAIGFLLSFSKNQKRRHWGGFIIGFAILFIGLQFLKDAVPDIKENPQVLEWLKFYTDGGFWSVLLFLLIGTVLTVVVQSSSATMALTLVLCYEGWIPFDMAAAMVLGENVGTTITANLAALVTNTNAKRTARAHLIFNLFGVLWMLILFVPFVNAINYFMTSANGASPFVEATAVPVALSIFHTSFNVINTCLLIWFIPLIVKIVTKLVKTQKEVIPDVDQPKFLSEMALHYPQTAIRSLLDESKRLFEEPAFEIIAHALSLHRSDIISNGSLKKVVKRSNVPMDIDVDDLYYSKVKSIYSKIIEYAVDIQTRFALSSRKTEALKNIKTANRHIVEMIKACSSLQDNIALHMKSPNEHIKKEYNRLRRKVSIVLREIYQTRISESPEIHLEKLESLRAKAEKSDVLSDGTFDKLIRKKLITSQMATSLANDSYTIAYISKSLIQVAELLYIETDTLLMDVTYKKPKSKNGKNKKK